MSALVCKHGNLARQCETCELEAEIRRLTDIAALGRMVRGDAMTFTDGSTYHFNHSRKGEFTARVLRQAGDWLDVVLVEGRAKYMVEPNAEVGDEITVRRSLLTAKLAESSSQEPK